MFNIHDPFKSITSGLISYLVGIAIVLFVGTLVAIAIGIGAERAHADTTNIKFGKFESHIDWGDWSMSTEEKVWLAGHLVDILQTETYHREQCYEEGNVATRRLIGREPDTARVLAWGAATTALNHYTFKFVENSNMPRWMQHASKWMIIAYKYDVITDNHELGVRIGKPAKKQPNQYGYCDW